MDNKKTNISFDIDNVVLDDVIGQEEAVKELREIVLLKNSKEISNYWKVNLFKGILFVGPPGVGKTMAARALSNELKEDSVLVEFKYNDIASMWFDKPIENLKVIFKKVEDESKNSHVFVFMDEIDSFLPKRDDVNIHHSTIKIVNEILNWMDGGYYSLENVTLIGATNNLGRVDPAVIRKGRFDKTIAFKKLNANSIIGVFESYMKKYKLSEEQVGTIDFNELLPILGKQELPGSDISGIFSDVLKTKAIEHIKMKKNSEVDIRPIPISIEDFKISIENHFKEMKVKNTVDLGYTNFINGKLF